MRWLLVALVALAPGSLLAEPRRAAVVIVGDADVAVTLADAVASRLSTIEAIELIGVARVEPPAAPPAPPPATDNVAAQLAAAVDRFYANQLDAALTALGAIERQLSEPSAANHAVRVEVALWRAAVLERIWSNAGRADPVPAELREAVHAALRLDPDVRIPMQTFWPRFAQLVESERRALPRVSLELRGLPPTASVFLEGRPIGPRAEVFAGTYPLRVIADGYLPHTEVLDLRSNLEKSLRLSPSVPTAAVVAVRAALGRGDSALQAVRQLASFDRADVAVVLDVDAQRGRVAITRGQRVSRSPYLDHRGVVDWIARAILADSDAAADRWRWELSARLGFASAGTTFTWGDSSISSSRSGGGVALGVTGQRSRWLVRMDTKLERDAVVDTPQSRSVEPTPTTGRSGWGGTAEGTAGARVGGDRFEFIPRLRVGLRTHRGGTLVFPGGDDPLTSGYTALSLGLGAMFRVRPVPRLSVEAGFAVDPLAVYLESPTRAGSANPPEIAGASAAVALFLGAGWVGELGVAYDRIEIQYVGMPQTHVTPAPLDARRLDEAFFFWIGLRRSLTTTSDHTVINGNNQH